MQSGIPYRILHFTNDLNENSSRANSSFYQACMARIISFSLITKANEIIVPILKSLVVGYTMLRGLVPCIKLMLAQHYRIGTGHLINDIGILESIIALSYACTVLFMYKEQSMKGNYPVHLPKT